AGDEQQRPPPDAPLREGGPQQVPFGGHHPPEGPARRRSAAGPGGPPAPRPGVGRPPHQRGDELAHFGGPARGQLPDVIVTEPLPSEGADHDGLGRRLLPLAFTRPTGPDGPGPGPFGGHREPAGGVAPAEDLEEDPVEDRELLRRGHTDRPE